MGKRILINKKIRKNILEIDNHHCKFPYCNLIERGKAKRLEIHHIDFNPENTIEENLITLCNYHNSMFNSNISKFLSKDLIEQYKILKQEIHNSSHD